MDEFSGPVTIDYHHGGASTSSANNTMDDSMNGGEDSTDKAVAAAAAPNKDSKHYKTTLCQFYLQGPCKNGDRCNYAHGTSELRTSTGDCAAEIGQSVSASKGDKKAYKTTLCAKFVTYGDCPFGANCNFAHGVKELRDALETVVHTNSPAAKNASDNPNFKTSLCKNYMVGLYCPFADQCQYAHGKHELREKPSSVPPSELSEEDRKKRVEKAKSLPGYKTKLCTNFDNEGYCEYDEMCHYAHGEDELREETEEDREAAEKLRIKRNPYYKTIMCKNLAKGECNYGDNCVYAHRESELRPMAMPGPSGPPHPAMMGRMFPVSSSPTGGGGGPAVKSGYKTAMCKNYVETGSCQFGAKCNFAHGPLELRGPNHHPPQGSGPMMMMNPAMAAMAMKNPRYKTSICTNIANGGMCPKGPMCQYAHNPGELRNTNSSSMPQQQMNNGLKHKTVMCTVYMEQGFCPRGDACNFAHSQEQLRVGQANDPKFKTAMCEQWQTTGYCDRQSNCKFAHGPGELRSRMGQVATYGNGASMTNSRYKTSMCTTYANMGFCDKGDGCKFAHGPGELRQPPNQEASYSFSGRQQQHPIMDNSGSFNYKTAMCRNMVDTGSCSRGDGCSFAHCSSELRVKKPMDNQNAIKRKRDNAKTMLCQNFSTFGECQYGDNCMYAHGEEDLAINKRQRF